MTRGEKIALAVAGAVVVGATVVAFARYVKKASFLGALPKAGKPYGDLIWRAARRRGVNPTLYASIIAHESGFGELLTPKGPGGTNASGDDLGLAQINKNAHAAWVATHDWRDPETNIEKGAEVLADALAAFPGNKPAGIAAYNAGATNVRRALAAGKAPGDVTTHDKQGRSYVENVVAQLERLQAAAA